MEVFPVMAAAGEPPRPRRIFNINNEVRRDRGACVEGWEEIGWLDGRGGGSHRLDRPI